MWMKAHQWSEFQEDMSRHILSGELEEEAESPLACKVGLSMLGAVSPSLGLATRGRSSRKIPSGHSD